ncbi:MAG: AAA family ATPase [Myxococcales bacterium]|nr:AAA family ATPase [Myxococcales bacterium]
MDLHHGDAPAREIAGVRISTIEAQLGSVIVFLGRRRGSPRRVVLQGGPPARVRAFLESSAARARVVDPALVEFERISIYGAGAARVSMCPDGQELTDRIARGPMSPPELLALARRLAAALRAAHRRGLALRSLRPENVILTPPGPVIVDRVPPEAPRDRADDPFTAPELRSGLAQAGDGRADVHGLGVLLWSCATGFVPTSANAMRGPFARWLATADDVPRALRQLIHELMQEPVSLRPLSVDGLVERVEALERSVIAGAPELAAGALGVGVGPIGCFDPPLIGREHLLAALARHLQGVRAGVATAVLLQGSSGIGKSHLLRAFLDRARSLGAGVMFTRGRPREPTPYWAIRGLIHGFLGVSASAAALAREAAGEYASVLAEFDGPLARLLGRERDPERSRGGDLDDVAGGDTLLHGALARFIGQLVARCPAAIVCIDDAQWLDEASARVVRRLAIELEKQAIMLLLTAPSDDAGDELAAALAPVQVHVITLEPLPAADATALVQEQLGRPADERALAGVVARCGGRPLSLILHARALVEDGALRLVDGAWRLDDREGRAGVVVSAPLALAGRLAARLDDDARALLGGCARLGLPLETGVIATVMARGRVDVARAMAAARRLGVIAPRVAEGGATEFSFASEPLRAALSRALDEEEAGRLHARASRTLSGERSIFARAIHSALAVPEEPSRSFELNLLAGRAAAACHAYSAARDFLRAAERAAERGGEASQLDGEFYLLVAIVGARVGAFHDAVAAGREALARTPGGLARAMVRSVLATLFARQHQFEDALAQLQAALRDAGSRPLRGGGLGWLRGAGSLAAVELGRGRRVPVAPEEALRVRLKARLIATCVAVGFSDLNTGRMLEAVMRGRALCDALPNCGERAVALMYYACSIASVAPARVFERDADEALAIAEALEDRGLYARLLSDRGIGAELQGRGAEAEANLRAALAVGEYWLSPLLYANAASSLAWLLAIRGYVLEAREWAERARTRSLTDLAIAPTRLPRIFAFLALIDALGGSFDDAALALGRAHERAREFEGSRLAAVGVVNAELRLCVEQGTLGSRFEELSARYLELVLQPRLVTPRERDGFFAIARGRLLQAMRRRDDGALGSLASLRAAVGLAGRAATTGLLRVLHGVLAAGVAWLSGRPREALTRLGALESQAERADSPRALVDVLWLRGHVLAALDLVDASREEARRGHALAESLGLRARARRIRREFALADPDTRVGSAVTVAASASRGAVPAALRLRRHFDTLIHVSLSAARASTREQQARLLLDDILAIHGAARGFLWLASDDDGDAPLVVGRDGDGRCDDPPASLLALVERARADRRAVIATVGDDHGRAGGRRRERPRSLMATPVDFGAHVLGYLCLEGHPDLGEFTSVDLQLLETLAHHVALAATAARVIRHEHAVAAARRGASEAIEQATRALGLAVVAVAADGALAQHDAAAESLAAGWASVADWWRALVVVVADPRWTGARRRASALDHRGRSPAARRRRRRRRRSQRRGAGRPRGRRGRRRRR